VVEYIELEGYPSEAEVDAWLDDIWAEAERTECGVELLAESGYGPQLGVRHTRGCQYVRFSLSDEGPFYGYWQPALSGPAPLLVHTPGYGAEMSAHPELVAQGFNVLHVNPLGYVTPTGPDEAKKRGDTWPVFQDTVASRAQAGYRQWLMQCVLAVRWAQSRAETLSGRVSFFGTSQGGGASLLLGSLFRGQGVRCVAADVPWLIHFPMARALDVEWGQELFVENPADGWYALGMIDALSHARRLDVPVLLTAGGADVTCRPETISALFERLPSTRSYC